MSPTDLGQWQRTSPLAILFFFGSILKLVAKNATQIIAPMAAFFVAFGGSTQTKIVIVAGGFALITTTASVLRYLFFRFRIAEDAVLIRGGVINKKQLDIKFSRIQGINTEQSFIYRWFDLVTVSFDTAGSAGSEGQLPAVKTAFSNALRETIGSVRYKEDTAQQPQTETAPVLTLDGGDMVKIGLADRRAFLLLAVVAPLFEQASDELGQAIANAIEDVAADLAAQGTAIAATILGGAVLLVFILLLLGSIVAAFLRYHNFALYLEGDRLRSVGGLLTRHEASMETGKVQVSRISQSIVMRWFGHVRLVLKQASSRQQAASKSFTIPAARPGFERAFLSDVLAPEARQLELDFDSAALRRVSPRFLWPGVLYFGILPALALILVSWPDNGAEALIFLPWIPLVALLQWQRWRRLAWRMTGDALVRRSGLLARRLDVFLLRKAQRVTVSQSPYQRRHGLATLRFFLASGTVKVPFVALANANRVRDYVLYKVESSTLPWH